MRCTFIFPLTKKKNCVAVFNSELKQEDKPLIDPSGFLCKTRLHAATEPRIAVKTEEIPNKVTIKADREEERKYLMDKEKNASC